MFDLSKLSTQYHVRPMKDADADALLAFCLQNDQYYRYCGKQPSRGLILHDLPSFESIHDFAKNHNAMLTVMECGEHRFHTDEQIQFLDDWIRRKEKEWT